MQKRNFFDSGFIAAELWKSRAKSASKVIPTISHDLTQEQYTALLRVVTTYKDLPIGEAFSNIIRNSKNLHHMSFLKTPSETVPELLLLEQFSVCGAEIAPELGNMEYGKMWNPLSTALTKSKSGEIIIASENIAIEVTVRSQLCYNFFKTTTRPWLNPNDLLFVANAYGEYIAMTIGRVYRLDMLEEVPIRYMFAWYFMLLCGVPTDKDGSLPLAERLGNMVGMAKPSIERISAHLNSLVLTEGDNININMLLSSLHDFIPNRAHHMDEAGLWSLVHKASPDGLQQGIALNYPPYFLAILLTVASIGKHTVITRMIRERNKPSEFMNSLRGLVRSGYMYA